jgi:FtsP/CotA-like multicopper oxidase with cupredoxin domain
MNLKKKKNSFFKPSLFLLEDRITPSAYVEPNVIIANPTTHVLDITYTAHQSSQPLESLVAGVPTSFSTAGFLTYAWEINDGSNTVNGIANSATTGDSYTGPTLKVNRGDTLRITLLNQLDNLGNLAIASVEDPNTVITEMPLNNHVHGLHISPNGSSDNVIMTMPAGQGFVYEYKIADTQPDGLYWIHPHNHLYSTQEVYRGLSSMLVIGSPDSSIAELAALPERTMSLQYQLLDNPGTDVQSLRDFVGAGGTNPRQQLTINGKLNPTLTVNPGQTEVWNIANMTSQVEANFTLKNSTTGAFLPIIVVAQDGIAYSTPVTIAAGTFLPLPLGTGGRISILVTASTIANQNVQLIFNNYANNNGTQRIPGTYSVNMKSAGTLVPSLPTPTTLTTTGFNPFVDLSTVPAAGIAENRTVTFSITGPGGNLNEFEINGEIFPNPEIFQPRLNTVEEWTLINNSNIPHPFHYHVNGVQVMSVYSPYSPHNVGLLTVTAPQQWYQDVINVPAAETDSQGVLVLDANGNVKNPGKVVIRTESLDFTGAFVYHCHILPHEDRGMMGLNTIQPETPIYVTGAGQGGGPAVNVYSSLDNSVLASFFAFDSSFTGGVQTAVADVNNDGISDLIVGAGPGGGPRVIVYNGATNFSTTLFDFFAFNTAFSGGVSVAGGDFNADGFADIVVGAGPGGGPQVNIFDGRTGNVLTQFFAYDQSFRGGVTVAVGDIDGSSFNSVITGAGAGGGSHVKSFRNSRFFDIDAARILPGNQSISMNQTGEFMAYNAAYTGGVQVAVGLNSGSEYGGFYRILTGTLTAGPEVTIWESMGSHDITMATPDIMFEKVADFFAFDSNLTTGVRVGSVAVSTGSDFLAATGSGTSTVVKRFSLLPGATQPTLEEEFSPYARVFDGGANLGGTY